MPCRTSGSEKTWRSEGTLLVPWPKRREGRGDGRPKLTTPEKVRKLQITLYRKAQPKPEYRFWSLSGEVPRADVLETAWRRVKANAGAAGVDGVTIESIAADREMEAEWLSRLREELHRKTYRPARRRRGIAGAGGRASHQKLMRLVARRVSDGMILKLNKAWLRAPILEEEEGGGRKMKANPCGTPQGGVIGPRPPALPCGLPAAGYLAPLGSPLLANLYLHPLDEQVNNDRQKPRLIRYADDLLILCRPGQGEGMKERLARWLQSRGLALNEQKTRVVPSRTDGFAFLGFSFWWQKSQKGKPYFRTEPSPAAEQALLARPATSLIPSASSAGRGERNHSLL